MPKKSKGSRHRIPFRELKSDPITPEYQAEVDRSTAELELRYAKAQKALERAEEKRARIAAQQARADENRVRAEAVAANRAAEEALLTRRIEDMRAAAQRARVERARKELDAKRFDAERQRALRASERKAQVQKARDEKRRLAAARLALGDVESVIEDRRRELREIERLMMPGNHAGSSHRGSGSAIHQAGGRFRP